MEEYLIGAISSDSVVRKQANEELSRLEKTEGFGAGLVDSFHKASEEGKSLSIIMLKNTIFKYWNAKNRFSDLDKKKIKLFLLKEIDEENPRREFFIECILGINKAEHLDTWPELIAYLSVFKPNPVYLHLLYGVVKAQFRKGSARSKTNLSQLLTSLGAPLENHWQNTYSLLLEKPYIALHSLKPTSEYAQKITSRCLHYISSRLILPCKAVLKGINFLILRHPDTLSPAINDLCSLCLIILSTPPQPNEFYRELILQTFLCLKDILIKFPQSSDILQPNFKFLLERSMTNELEERFELWNSGDYANFLESTNDADEDSIRKFQEVLIRSVPGLLQTISELIRPDLTFMQIHIICNLYCVLHKFQETSESDYKMIITWLSSVQVEGLGRLVLLRDSLVLTRKWLNKITDFAFVYSLLVNIKNLTNDGIVLYECCLTLKQMMYAKPDPETLMQITNDFAITAFQLIPQVHAPSCVWHLITFISNLIEASDNNEIFIQGLSQIGLEKLIIDDSEMVMISVGDMLERLIVSYPGNEMLNRKATEHIKARLRNGDKLVAQLWVTFLLNFKGNTETIDELLQFFDQLPEKQRSLKVKIAEEYLLIYYEQRLSDKISGFISRIADLCNLTNNCEYDYLSLELLFCIIGVHPSPDLSSLSRLNLYFQCNIEDIFEKLCLQYTLLIISAVLLKSSSSSQLFDLVSFLQKLSALTTHNHLVLVSKSLSNLPTSLQSAFSPSIYSLQSQYSSYLRPERIGKKVFIDCSGVSDRFSLYLFS